MAAAPACDYSCSTAGCCRALCTSARLPRSARTPHATPGWAGVLPLLLSIPAYGNQGTPALAACRTGQRCGARMAFSGVSSQGWGGTCMPVADSTDWAGLTVHLGPNPNTSGKFPVSSASAWHSRASAASRGSDPRRGSASPRSHLPGTCQASQLTHDTAEPAAGTGSLRPTAACCASVSPLGGLRSGGTFSSRPKQSRPPCRLAHDALSQRECNVLPAVPHRRLGRARLYKYPSLGTHRTQSPAKSRQRPASLFPAVPPATHRSLPRHPDTRSRPQPLPAFRNTSFPRVIKN